MKQKRSFWKNRFVTPGKLRDAMELYPGKTREEVQNLLWKELRKKLFLGGGLSVLFLVLAFVLASGKQEISGTERPAPGNAAVSKQVLLELDEEWQTLTLPVGAMEYEEAQIEQFHQAAEAYLEEIIAGENESLEKVTGKLYFPESFPECGAKIDWSTDAPWLVTSEGEVKNEELTGAKEVVITAEISYGTEKRYFSKKVVICPKIYTEKEKVLRAAQLELVKLEKESRTSERFELPTEVLGYSIKPAKEASLTGETFLLLLAAVVPLLCYFGYFGTLDTNRKKRKEEAENSYTEFITKLSLMLAAGVSIRQAFFRLAEEYETNRGEQHVLTQELQVTKQELENGHSESEVYDAFGRRIGVLAYRRMASLLTQNVLKGVQGIRNLLLQEAKEVMVQERANIRTKGEQAGTKLLFPMMGLLFLVFAILLVPAFQSF